MRGNEILVRQVAPPYAKLLQRPMIATVIIGPDLVRVPRRTATQRSRLIVRFCALPRVALFGQ